LTRLLLDQGLPQTAVQKLGEVGWDVVHTLELGLERATDSNILEYARKQDRTIVTLDADFHALLAVRQENSPSVIRIRKEGLSGDDLAKLLLEIWPNIESSISKGAAVTVTQASVRIRQLPI